MLVFWTILFLIISVLLTLIILVQRGRGGGLSGAFGMGGGGGGSAFGTKTGDVFTTVTVVLFAIFLLMAIGLNFKYRSEKGVTLAPLPSAAPSTPGMGAGPTTLNAELTPPNAATQMAPIDTPPGGIPMTPPANPKP